MNVSCLRAGAIGEPVRAVGVTDKRRQSALDTPTAVKLVSERVSGIPKAEGIGGPYLRCMLRHIGNTSVRLTHMGRGHCVLVWTPRERVYT